MLSQRLVSLIEAHADEMARQVVSEALTNPRTPHISRVPREEMRRRAYDVYHNLGKWLGQQAETAIEETYRKLGGKRADEGIPLEEVVYGQMLIKHHLRDFVRGSGLGDSALDLYQEEELYLLVEQFFDRVIYYTVKGYGEATARRRAS
jgi:hypothetical protein